MLRLPGLLETPAIAAKWPLGSELPLLHLLSMLLSSHFIWPHESIGSQSQCLIYMDTGIKTQVLILAVTVLVRDHSPPSPPQAPQPLTAFWEL